MLKEFGRGIQVAQNLLVVRCDPGAAPGIGRVIDELDHEAILGCVAGDDTVILVTKDSKSAKAVYAVPNRAGRLITDGQGTVRTRLLRRSGHFRAGPLYEGEVRLRHRLRSGGCRADEGPRRACACAALPREPSTRWSSTPRRSSSSTSRSALKANALYEGKYPLHSALSRPLISKKMVELAHEYGAKFIAHGCTAKGNDQVRMDVSIRCLDPTITVLGPAREWGMTRPELLDYLAERGIDLPLTKKNPYSIDENLWGRAIECGELEDPWAAPPDDAYQFTVHPKDAPDEAVEVVVSFEAGIPVAIDGKAMGPVELVETLDLIGGAHGFGRVDMVENRLVGIKSREIYEVAGSLSLIMAHRELEDLDPHPGATALQDGASTSG